MLKKLTPFFIVALLVAAFALSGQKTAQTQGLPLCGPGESPPDCTQGHDVSLTCDLNEVYESGVFIGWDVVISATTSPEVQSNLNGYGTNGIFDNTNYTSQYTYTKFIQASLSDPKPTFDFVAGVTEPLHVGSAECHQTDSTPPGGGANPAGQISASPNPCAIPSGSVACTSYINWQTSDVQEAKVYVSRNGGPESLFSSQLTCSGQACPASFITPTPDFYDFRLYNFSNGFRMELLDSVRVTGERTSPPDRQPNGSFDTAECTLDGGQISGWAFDPDASGTSIDVLVYRDGPLGSGGVFVGSFPANVLREDVNTTFKITGNHGFSISPLPDVFRDGGLHQVYVYAVNDNRQAPNPLLLGSPKPLQCPLPPVCPSTSTARVALSSGTIRVGEKAIAVAPSGWTGGSYSSSSAVAQIGTQTGTSVEVNGVGVGTARITGKGWKASNGAEGCDLGSALLSVEAAPDGNISANPNTIPVCIGATSGVTSITATANVYAEVRVYNAEGLADGSVFFTLLAFETKTVPTGPWAKQGTEFRLVSPLFADVTLDSVTVSVVEEVCPDQVPHVDLKAVNPDGSLTDGPVSVSVGSSIPLDWTSGNTDSCKAVGGWTTNQSTSGREPSGQVFSSKTFVIECTGPGGTVSDSVTVNVILALDPSVDLKAVNPDGSLTDGPVSVPTGGGTVDLTWTSENTDSCMAVNGWTSSQAVSGTQSGIVVSADTTFEIVCFGGGRETRDTVTVVVNPGNPGGGGGGPGGGGSGGGPVSSTVYNTTTAAGAGLSVACGQIIATWTRPEEAVDGFRMYYYDTSSVSWKRLWDIPYSAAQTVGSGSNSRFFSRFTPPGGELSKLFRYRVYTYLGGQEFPPSSDATGSPIATDWPCGGNLDGSNKDIVAIRDIPLDFNPQVDQDHNVEKAVPVIAGDKVTFQINIVNSGDVDYTDQIIVDDDMTNLAKPAGGWDISIDCNNQCDHRVIDFDPVTRRMTFVLTPRNNQSLAAGGVEYWTIRFTAVAKPENPNTSTFRFQNTAYVNGATSDLLRTPRILAFPAGSPIIKEIQ